MSTIGTLQIEMMANIARLQQDMDKAKRAVGDAAGKMSSDMADVRKTIEEAIAPIEKLTVKFGSLEDRVNSASKAAFNLGKGLILGAAAGMSIDAIVGKINGAIDSMAALKTLSEKTGSSVEGLSRLGGAAKASGADLESVVGAMNKLSMGMAGADNETKGAGKALAFLGLSAKDAAGNLKDPSTLFTEIAGKLNEYQDGAGKAAIAQAMFGRSGADLLPTLKTLAEQGSKAASVTDEQATAARQYQRDLAALKGQQNALFKMLATSLMPTMSDFASVLLDAGKNTNIVNGEAKKLSEEGSLTEWADFAAMGLARLLDVIKVIPSFLGALSSSVKVVWEDLKTLWSMSMPKVLLDLKNGKNPIEEFKAQLEERNKVLDDANQKWSNLWNMEGDTYEKAMARRIANRQKNREQQAAQDALDAAANAGKKRLNYSTTADDGAGDANDKQADAYRNLIVKINEKIAANEQEIATAANLTQAQQMQLTINSMVEKGLIRQRDAQSAATRSALEALAVSQRDKEMAQAQAKALEDLRRERMQDIKAQEAAAAAAVASNQALSDEIEMIGLTAGQQVLVLQQRNAVTIATKEAHLAELERQSAITGFMSREEYALQQEIEALKERNRLLGAKYDATETAKAAQEAADSWKRFTDDIYKGLTDSLMRGFESGKNFFRSFWDGIVNSIKTTVLRPVIQAIIQPVVGAMGLSMSGTAAAGQSGGSALSSAGGLANLYSMGSKIYNGVGTLGTSAIGAVGSGISTVGSLVGSESMVGYSAGLQYGSYASSSYAAMADAGMVSQSSAAAATSGANMASTLGPYAPYANALGGALVGFMAGKMISGGYSVIGNSGNVAVGAGTAIGYAVGGPIGAAIGGAIGGVVNRAFGMGAKKVTGTGISGTFSESGADVQQYTDWHQSGGWFRSGKSGTGYSAVSSELDQTLDVAVRAVTAANKGYAQSLGLSVDAVKGFSQAIKVSLQGLDEAGQQKAIMDAVANFGKGMVDKAYGSALETYRRTGETSVQTLARLSTSLTAVNQVFDTLGQKAFSVSLAGGDMAQQLIDLFGGLDKLQAATSSYYQDYYTEAERSATATRQISAALGALGYGLPATRDGFRALVEAQDLTTESGRATYTALLQLAPAFSSLTSSALNSVSQIKSYLSSLRTGSLSTLDPGQQLASVETSYTLSLAAARAGDSTALAGITQSADQYLNAARSYYGSTASYADLYGRVTQQLSDLAGIPTRATGGYTSPGWTLVGEQGPELVNFTAPGRVYTAQQTADALGGEGAGAGNDGTLLRELIAEVRALRQQQGGESSTLVRKLGAIEYRLSRLEAGSTLERAR